MAYAKAGDKPTEKAKKFWTKHFARLSMPDVVAPKAPGNAGQWICIDCGEGFQNNMQAGSHAKKHRLAWRNFETGDMEEA